MAQAQPEDASRDLTHALGGMRDAHSRRFRLSSGETLDSYNLPLQSICFSFRVLAARFYNTICFSFGVLTPGTPRGRLRYTESRTAGGGPGIDGGFLVNF